MRKRLILYLGIIILLFFVSSSFVIPEIKNYKKMLVVVLLIILLGSTIYNILKSKLFGKILFIVLFIFDLGVAEILEPTSGFIFESEKQYVTKLDNMYLYRKYVWMDGYLLLYEKSKYLPILHFKASKELFTTEDDKISLKKIDGKIYVQINDNFLKKIE